MRRAILAVLVIQLLAAGAAAQNAAEFGRASGGVIDAITKEPRKTSGSLGLSHATGRGNGYEATLGGELLQDRLWFFGAASVLPRTQFTTDFTAIDAKATAQPVDWTTIAASYTELRQPDFGVALPRSFLSLRSTSILSDRMTLDVSFSRR